MGTRRAGGLEWQLWHLSRSKASTSQSGPVPSGGAPPAPDPPLALAPPVAPCALPPVSVAPAVEPDPPLPARTPVLPPVSNGTAVCGVPSMMAWQEQRSAPDTSTRDERRRWVTLVFARTGQDLQRLADFFGAGRAPR